MSVRYPSAHLSIDLPTWLSFFLSCLPSFQYFDAFFLLVFLASLLAVSLPTFLFFFFSLSFSPCLPKCQPPFQAFNIIQSTYPSLALRSLFFPNSLQSACLPVCLSASLSACLPACPSACLSTNQSTAICRSISWSISLPTSLPLYPSLCPSLHLPEVE